MTSMEWFNEPSKWSNDDGHIYGQVVHGDRTTTATFSATPLTGRFDQVGLALRIDSDNWSKTGVEVVDEQPQARPSGRATS